MISDFKPTLLINLGGQSLPQLFNSRWFDLSPQICGHKLSQQHVIVIKITVPHSFNGSPEL